MIIPTLLQTYRDEIDEIDHNLINLIAKRFVVTEKVGRYKARHKLPSTDVQREHEQYERITKIAKENKLNPEIARAVIALLISFATKNHNRLAHIHKRSRSNLI